MLHITSWLHTPLYLLVPIYFTVWKEFWVICRTPEVGSTAEPGMLPAFSLANKTETAVKGFRITWCSSAIQVITSLKEPLSQLYSFPWNLQRTFWGPQIVPFSNHHIKSFKEDIKAEEKARWAYACPKQSWDRTRTNCSCAQSHTCPEQVLSLDSQSSLWPCSWKSEWKGKLEGMAMTEFLGSHTHPLKMDFKVISQTISQLIMPVISSLEPGQDVSPGSSRTDYTVWHICVTYLCDVISLGSTFREFTT